MGFDWFPAECLCLDDRLDRDLDELKLAGEYSVVVSSCVGKHGISPVERTGGGAREESEGREHYTIMAGSAQIRSAEKLEVHHFAKCAEKQCAVCCVVKNPTL